MKKKTHIKHVRLSLALTVVAIMTLGFVASTVSAWDWPDPPDIPDLPDLPDWDPPEWNPPEWDPSELENYWKDFQDEQREDLDSAIEMARNAPYISESWDVISLEKERQLYEDYNDPTRVSELERRRGLMTEVAIAAIKLMPVYDPERGQVRTFSGFAADLVNESPALAGSDLAEDPVRFAALLLLDSDYLSYAKIIKTNEGKWISIEEARVLGYKTNEVNAAKSEYLQAKNAYSRKDSELVEKHLGNFSSRIQTINKGSDFDSLWLLPTAMVAFAGIVSIGLLIKRSKRKDEAKME